jgi:hypothetical protein
MSCDSDSIASDCAKNGKVCLPIRIRAVVTEKTQIPLRGSRLGRRSRLDRRTARDRSRAKRLRKKSAITRSHCPADPLGLAEGEIYGYGESSQVSLPGSLPRKVSTPTLMSDRQHIRGLAGRMKRASQLLWRQRAGRDCCGQRTHLADCRCRHRAPQLALRLGRSGRRPLLMSAMGAERGPAMRRPSCFCDNG